jgi:hypothetical protein
VCLGKMFHMHRQYGKYIGLNTVECNTVRIFWSAYVRFCNTHGACGLSLGRAVAQCDRVVYSQFVASANSLQPAEADAGFAFNHKLVKNPQFVCTCHNLNVYISDRPR